MPKTWRISVNTKLHPQKNSPAAAKIWSENFYRKFFSKKLISEFSTLTKLKGLTQTPAESSECVESASQNTRRRVFSLFVHTCYIAYNIVWCVRTFRGTLPIEYHTFSRYQPLKIALKPHSGPVFPTFDNSEKIKNQNQPKGYQKFKVREKKLGINWKSSHLSPVQFLSKSVENSKK